ncbi:MAG: signal peptidase II [Planctomycetota bacterium]
MSAEGEHSIRLSWVRWASFCAIAVFGTAIDLWTKYAVFSWLGLPGQQDVYWIIEGYVGIETAVNPGALFGMGAGFGLGFAALSVVAAIAIGVWLYRYRAIESWWLLVSLGSVTGGIFGNLYDRLGLWNPPPEIPLWASGVRDWIRLSYGEHTWPNFNIADSLLVCGAIMLFLHSLLWAPPTDDDKSESAPATES